MRIFLDANVPFSASHPGSATCRLIAAAMRSHTIVTSDVACSEARKNLTLKRPSWSGPFENLIENMELQPSSVFALPVTLDTKDLPLLCASIRARCHYFVTGDQKDFGHLFDRTILGVTIIRPLRLAQILAQDKGSELRDD